MDDCSTDNSYEIAKKTSAKVFRNKKNLGPSGTRNFGAKKAKGDIIIFAEADGKYSPNYIKEIIKPLEDETAGGVLSGRRIVWTNKKNLFVKFQNLKWEVVNDFMNEGKRKIIGAWAFRKAVFNQMGGIIKNIE